MLHFLQKKKKERDAIFLLKDVTSSCRIALYIAQEKLYKPSTAKTYLRKDAAYNFIKYKMKESKYCKEIMKKQFNK